MSSSVPDKFFAEAPVIYVYEHVTATADANDPLSVEAAAMYDAVSTDFAEIDGVEVVGGFADRFDELAATCDGLLVIAPETGGVLAELVRRAEARGAKLLSPSSSFCEWAADKSRVAETMRAAGVPMPEGTRFRLGDLVPADIPLPAVLKPNDGCGSQGIVLLRDPLGNALGGVSSEMRNAAEDVSYRLETFVTGVAASVAVLRGPGGIFPLPGCLQRLVDDGTFQYLGGSCPLPEAIAARAETLACRAAAAMPDWRGYVGLDVVLGAADDGSQDFLIEVNPRLTTSYVGLRALSETNLAAAMLDVVAGRAPTMSFRDSVVEFDADGTLWSAGTNPAANLK